jgi:hypothetical protein
MNKNEIKQLKNSYKINITTNALNESKVKNNNSEKKESYISLNKKISKSISSNHIYDTIDEDIKSKNSKSSKNKKKEKGSSNKKKKSKGKLLKILKNNEKLKIPTGRRRSCVPGDGLKLNINNINNLLKALVPPKDKKKFRTDKNGVVINKDNKKKVHITFLDEISPNHKITDTINIQSFKQYNFIEQIPGEDILPKISKCCSIF